MGSVGDSLSLVIRGGRVIDPAGGFDDVADIYIEDGRVAAIGDFAPPKSVNEIDAKGLWVCPGFIDLHAHLREPGFTGKETIATASRAAAAGGFTTICAMPNTSPVADNAVVIEYIKLKAAREACVNVLPIGAITKGQAGEELAEIGLMREAGAAAISEDGKSVLNAALMRTALTLAGGYGMAVLDHCEDPALGATPAAEETITARDIILARETKARLHICHVSTAFAAKIIRAAQNGGISVTAEVTPHHFTLCRDESNKWDTNYKMSPCLRTSADVKAMKDALASGVISVIATDHAPHTFDEKNVEYAKAPNGIIGLETAVSLGISELVVPGVLSPMKFVACFTANPAGVIGIDGGKLAVGGAADVTIIDPNYRGVIDESRFKGKSRNTPFIGRDITGRAVMTIVGGRIAYDNR